MKLEIVMATDRVGGIGKDGRLPWPHCKEDMKRFQQLTKDVVCVMGSVTYQDILAAATERQRTLDDIKEHGILKGRESVVLSTTRTEFDGAVGMNSLRAVFNAYADTDKRVIVIGGEKLFIQSLTWASVVHVTVIDGQFACDRHFPMDVLTHGGFTLSVEKIKPSEFECDVYFATYTRNNPVTISL